MSMIEETGPVIFGEVLYDCFPDGAEVLGGAPFNVAWHLQAFGLSPLIISSVGDDALGEKVRRDMRQWRMDERGLQTDRAHPTGSVAVELARGEPRYTILEQRAYDYIDAAGLPSVGFAPLLYHGTLALRNTSSRKALERLRKDLDTTVLLDVNLRDPWWRRDDVLSLIDSADWVKLNRDELELLSPTGGNDLHERALHFLDKAKLSGLIITLGAKGAFACSASGETTAVEPASVQEVVDTVGAGDAFTSVLVLGLLHDWPMALTLRRAQDFASRVVAQRGATIGDLSTYQHVMQDWIR